MGFQRIHDRLIYGRKALWQVSHRERKRGCDLTWSLRGLLGWRERAQP